MEEEKKLYPFRLLPIEVGNESVQIADLGYQDTEIQNGYLSADSISEVMDMYMDRVVGEHVFGWYGRQFPVLMKYIRVSDRLPLTVCPDDETAEQRLDFLGKAKLWYIVEAADDARLYLGFASDVESADFYMACRHGDIDGMLHEVKPRKGEAFFIKPGTVHSASGSLVIAEVAESSPLDFRIFDWGRGFDGDEFDAELNLDAAFDFIDYSAYRAPEDGHHHEVARVTRTLTDCPEFKVTEISLTDALHIYCEKFGSFMFYTCIRGGATVQATVDSLPCSYQMDKFQSILVPAEVSDFVLVPRAPGTILLEVVVEKRPEIDSYTGEESDVEDGCCHEDGCGDHHHDGCGCGHHHHDDDDDECDGEDCLCGHQHYEN